MRRQLIALSLLTMAAAGSTAAAPPGSPSAATGATAAAADTAQEIAKHGVTLRFHGADSDIVFTPDGKFTGLGGRLNGTWRIEGDQICSGTVSGRTENCVPYPPGKRSGDSFEVNLPAGPATVTIN